MRLRALVATLVLSSCVPTSREGVHSALRYNVAVSSIEQTIRVLADDSMKGRATPSPGLERTATWIAGEVGRSGLDPLSGPGLVLRYELPERALDPEASSFVVDGKRLLLGRDWVMADGPPWNVSADAPVLRLGEGLAPPEDSLAGRIVLLDVPAAVRPDELHEQLRWGRRLRRGGARVVLIPWPAVPGFATPESGPGPNLVAPFLDPEAPLLYVHPAALGDVPSWGDNDLAPLHARLDIATRVVATRRIPNVVGVLPGRTLPQEFVVLNAHMDHLGVSWPDASGDSIYNGADDNASGVAALLEAARVLAAEPATERSLVFLFDSGEELGLWGAEMFVRAGYMPMDSVVADLNVDMVGRNSRDSIPVLGMAYSSLGDVARSVAGAAPGTIPIPIPDPWPDEDYFYRSDHLSFVLRGVPALFLFRGVHADYHRPSDEIGRVDPEAVAAATRLLVELARAVADAPERPKWDPEALRRFVGG